jgi:hypothetical protein
VTSHTPVPLRSAQYRHWRLRLAISRVELITQSGPGLRDVIAMKPHLALEPIALLLHHPNGATAGVEVADVHVLLARPCAEIEPGDAFLDVDLGRPAPSLRARWLLCVLEGLLFAV